MTRDDDTAPFDNAVQPPGVAVTQEEEIARLEAENASLRSRVAELERQLGLNSSNSGKPPSSDGLKKPKREPRTKSQRPRSGRSPGGQKGHKGETLRQVAEPDETVDHFPEACSSCGTALGETATSADYQARQVFDLPQPQPLIVTEHRAHKCTCGQCGQETRAAFPEGVAAPVQYGPRIVGIVVYLACFQLLPVKRLGELMSDLFGLNLSTATIAGMSADCAGRFESFVACLCNLVKEAAVKHLDETGVRIGKAMQWLHVAATPWICFYRISPKRGSLLTGILGTVVHDHWRPYYTLKGVLHALCNAHHLRELQALVDIEKEQWAADMQRLLRRACHAANLALERGIPLKPALIDLFRRRYAVILAQGTAYHEGLPPLSGKPAIGTRKRKGPTKRRTGHNLLIRLETRMDDVLRFLIDPAVPFTNNLAEIALRMMKLRLKISGCFRSEQGAADFATIRSVIATAKKQGWNVIDALRQTPEDLLEKLRTA